MKRGKDQRRFQARKHKEKTRKFFKDVLKRPELAEDDRFVGIESGVHSRRCSCPMCKRGKNPRKEQHDDLVEEINDDEN